MNRGSPRLTGRGVEAKSEVTVSENRGPHCLAKKNPIGTMLKVKLTDGSSIDIDRAE
jgi:hypothetical protein